MAKKPKLGRPPGSAVHTEETLVRLSPELKALVEAAARDAGVSASEWWRRAAAHYASCAHAGLLADED